jgi:predicted CopG family antitoxin|tara:strand:+ start:109 stop:372 length:264 start_codon:yes stop_codon:yes gene_type:complete
MGRKGIQVDEEVFNAVKEMYPDMSWSNILRLLLEPKGLPKDKPKDYIASRDENEETSLYASKDDLKALKDKFSMVLTQLIKKNNLQK